MESMFEGTTQMPDMPDMVALLVGEGMTVGVAYYLDKISKVYELESTPSAWISKRVATDEFVCRCYTKTAKSNIQRFVRKNRRYAKITQQL